MGYHRKLSLTGQWQFLAKGMGFHRKLSLTGQWQFLAKGMGFHRKLSLTSQWQILLREWVITENCHWPVNDNFEAAF